MTISYKIKEHEGIDIMTSLLILFVMFIISASILMLLGI